MAGVYKYIRSEQFQRQLVASITDKWNERGSLLDSQDILAEKVISFPSPSKSWKEAAIDNTADENLWKVTRWKKQQAGSRQSIYCRGSSDCSSVTHQITEYSQHPPTCREMITFSPSIPPPSFSPCYIFKQVVLSWI